MGAIGRFEAALGVVGLAALGIAYSMVTGWNPLPGVQDWLNRGQTLAEPAPAWTVRTGDQPSGAVVAGNVVLVTAGTSVSGYALGGGAALWTREVAWSAVAGASSAAVVVAGRKGKGYEALDPASGAVRWSDPAAIGAWTFTDLVIGVACPQSLVCVLTARTPGNGAVRWELALTGNARPLAGANRPLIGVRPLVTPDHAPRPAPALLGFPVGDEVQVVDTQAGARPRVYRSSPTAWVAVAGTRVVVSRGDSKRGRCHLSAEGRDPDGDRLAWRLDGYDLHTANVQGCDQRTGPIGGGGLLAARAPDGAEVLLDATTGDEAFRARAGEKVLATDGRLVLVRSADRAALRAVDVDSGAVRWSRPAAHDAGVSLGPGVVVISDLAANRLVVLSTAGLARLDVSSAATVLGYADDGLLVNVGRQVGLIRYPR